MASDQKFVAYLVEQMDSGGLVTSKAMFGEYALYFGNKLYALVCDNKLFIKPTEAGRNYLQHVTEAPPYPGAKPSFLIEENLEDRDWLRQLARITAEALPEPKPKKEKKKG